MGRGFCLCTSSIRAICRAIFSGWMISGGRYMLCCAPLFVILAKVKSDGARRLLLMGFAFLFVTYSYFYLLGYAIM